MHLQGDRMTSVVIPAALAVFAGAQIVRGLYNMANGKGKKEGF